MNYKRFCNYSVYCDARALFLGFCVLMLSSVFCIIKCTRMVLFIFVNVFFSECLFCGDDRIRLAASKVLKLNMGDHKLCCNAQYTSDFNKSITHFVAFNICYFRLHLFRFDFSLGFSMIFIVSFVCGYIHESFFPSDKLLFASMWLIYLLSFFLFGQQYYRIVPNDDIFCG